MVSGCVVSAIEKNSIALNVLQKSRKENHDEQRNLARNSLAKSCDGAQNDQTSILIFFYKDKEEWDILIKRNKQTNIITERDKLEKENNGEREK